MAMMRRLAVAAALAAGALAPAAAQPRVRAPLSTQQLAAARAAAAASRLDQAFDGSPVRKALAAPVPGRRVRRKAAPKPQTPIPDFDRPQPSQLHQDLVVPVPKEDPIYRHTFGVLLQHPEKTDRWDDLIIKYARKYRLDARFLKSIMAAESEFNPLSVSPAGARGLMQVMPRTAEAMGVRASDLYDPEPAIKAGAAYIQNLFRMAWRIFKLDGVRYTDVPHWLMQRVIAAYHAGPKFLTTKRWFPSTRAYVRKVVLFYHSKVTDLRRPASSELAAPPFAQSVAPSGTLY